MTLSRLRPRRLSAAAAALLLGLTGCGQPDYAPDADAEGHSAPTAATIAANQAVAKRLPLDDPADFEAASRGFIAREEALVIERADGRRVWDRPAYDFVDGPAPDSANPSLWRQARLNNLHGLFEVVPGIYQLRGYDLANMTLIEGERGWIVVDPLTTTETARRALAFAQEQLGERPVVAVIYSHSHIDHFGGVLGVTSAEAVREGAVQIIAPARFMEEATSENVLGGPVMARRAMFMYGSSLARSPRGHIGTGLGKEPAAGSYGILPPSRSITEDGERLTIDGVELVFQLALDSEAPSEMTFYLPQHKAFVGAEIVSRNLHNLYTLRGAKVRDALKWSGYIDDALQRFGDAEVYIGTHHWPMWGNEAVRELMRSQRDAYKFIHDQTLRLAQKGLTPREIAETLTLPDSLGLKFWNRDYYGTVSHNAKAVYQRYFGWYDGNPAHLNPLPPGDSAPRYVAAMGGADKVMETATAAFEAGDYRWVAELLNHLVFAEPGHHAARELLARSYDQLGYQAESGPWRDAYLSGAFELRHGPPEQGLDFRADAVAMLRHTPVPHFLNAMAAALDADKAEGKSFRIRLELSDLGEAYRLELDNSVLHHRVAAKAAAGDGTDPDATLRISHALFLDMMLGELGLRELVFSEDLSIEGSRIALTRFLALFDQPDPTFAIVTP